MEKEEKGTERGMNLGWEERVATPEGTQWGVEEARTGNAAVKKGGKDKGPTDSAKGS